jgi:two-component system sensor kinase FixL
MPRMTTRVLSWPQLWPAPPLGDMGRTLVSVGIYLALYLALDRISFFQVLPGTGFTPWNPPPAASLALLVLKGPRFAPALFLAGMIDDIAVVGLPNRLPATAVMEAITALGYTAVAIGLRRFAHAEQGFPRVADVVVLLLGAFAGTLTVATLAVGALVLLHGLPPAMFHPSVWHFFIGDLTGIVGLLPALLTAAQAWQRWKEMPAATRVLDIGVFALSLGIALALVFGVARSKELQFFYLLLLPVVWIGVRNGLAWSAMAILLEQLALIATVALRDYPAADFLAYQMLSLAVAGTGLLLGAVVTERQRAELQLRQWQAELYRSARLTTAGALGAAVVHEISQPLATVATYAHVCRRLLARHPPDLGLIGQTVAKVESEVRRTGEIVERMRDLWSKGEPRWSRLDLAEVTRKVAGALDDMARETGVTLRVEAQPLPPIAADRVQLEQVLVNLLRNAIEAAAEGSAAEKLVSVALARRDDKVELAVADNGRGVAPDIAERLFAPFETSKPRGMGIGLTLSREIVEAHRGQLWRDPTAAVGARFVLRLPAVEPQPQ